MADRIRVEISPLRLAALIVISGTIALAAIAPPARATSSAATAASSGGNSGTPGENGNTPNADTNTSSSEGDANSDGNTGTSDGNTGTSEEPPSSPPEPPGPPPPPFLGQLKTTIEGQAGNAREGRGYQYEITVHNLGPGTLSGARLRVMLPGRYFIEDVSDSDHSLRSAVRHEDESGLPRHWRVWRLADLPAGAEMKFTIQGHFAIRKHQSGDTFDASAAVVFATGGRESGSDDVNVVRRRPNQ